MYITNISVEIFLYYGMVSMQDTKLETANSLKQAMDPAYFIIRLQI